LVGDTVSLNESRRNDTCTVTRLLLPVSYRATYSVDALCLQVDIRRLHALMVLLWVAAASRLSLRQLWVQSCRLVCLTQLHPFHRLIARISLAIY